MIKSLEILVIEEDDFFGELFKQLETDKIKIKIVSNGVEAYKILYKTSLFSQHDYIITNIGLPDENGVEIIKFIKMFFTSKVIIYTSKKFDFYKDICSFDYFFDKKITTPENIIEIILNDIYKS